VEGLGRARCEGRRQLRRSLRAQRRIAIETRDSPWLKRTLDQWWSSICSTDTIAIQSKSDGAELIFDTGEGDPQEGRSKSPAWPLRRCACTMPSALGQEVCSA